MLKRALKVFSPKNLNQAYVDRIANFRDYGVTVGDVKSYQSMAVTWAMEMLKLEKPAEFRAMVQRNTRYDRLFHEEQNYFGASHLVSDLNAEQNALAPYLRLYAQITREKQKRGIRRYQTYYGQ